MAITAILNKNTGKPFSLASLEMAIPGIMSTACPWQFRPETTGGKIMFNLSRLETFVNCGFTRDPFRGVNFETADSLRIQRILSMAINGNSLVSIVGERGMGKTRAINSALASMKVKQVAVRAADKARLLISDIEQAMVLDLSDEKPKRGKEIRARQLRRILGEASMKHDIVVVIEEGHRLHGMTLRALKTLREMDWMGKTDLFSVVLVAQSDPMMKPGVSEVRLRSDTIHMNGLSTDEIRSYINETVGKVFTEDAVDKIADLPESRNFLNLQNMLVSLMINMVSTGADKVDMNDVTTAFDNAPKAMEKRPARRQKSQVQPVHGNDVLRNVLKGRQNNDKAGAGIAAAV